MKTAHRLGLVLLSCALLAPSLRAASSPSGDSSPEVNGPHQRIYRLKSAEAPDGQAATEVRRKQRPQPRERQIVELSTGMNYWDGQQWSPSQAVFEPTEEGFVAQRVHHQTRLSANLNQMGAVSVNAPGSGVLSSTPVGIALYDTESGRFQLIGAITNCQGVLVSSNRVAYDDAFSGVCASLVYTIEQGSIEQDVVFTGRLDPSLYGFPPQSTLIQVWTEFYSQTQPERVRRPLRVEKDAAVRARKASPDLTDETLTFGELTIGAGQAYTMPSPVRTNGTAALVFKEFKQVNGRTFLVESLEYAAIEQGMKSLPDCGGASGTAAVLPKSGYAALPRLAKVAQGKTKPLARSSRFALAPMQQGPSLVVDYFAVLQSTDTVLRADTTYLVSGTVNLGNLVLEGGTVLKYKQNASISVSGIACKTSTYQPAIVTCVDDDSVGETVRYVGDSGWTGVIGDKRYANPAFIVRSDLAGVKTFSNVRFLYAQEAVRLATTYGIYRPLVNLSHAQLVNCVRGVTISGYTDSSICGVDCTLFNCLLDGVPFPLTASLSWGYSNPYVLGAFSYCTVVGATNLVTVTNYSVGYDNDGRFDVSVAGCIFAKLVAWNNTLPLDFEHIYPNRTLSITDAGFYQCPSVFATRARSASDWPFQSVGGGKYYLTEASGFRNCVTGTDKDLKLRTTYPPQILPAGSYAGNQTYGPIVQRDTDLLDLGYHYAPLDYLLYGTYLTGGTLTVRPGTALGMIPYGHNYGMALCDGANLQCLGTVTQPIIIAKAKTVQEQPITDPIGNADSIISAWNPVSVLPRADFRFTKWHTIGLEGNHFRSCYPVNTQPMSFWGCEFFGGGLVTSGPSFNVTNCLFDRAYVEVWDGGGNGAEMNFYNNLFRGGSCVLAREGGLPWVFRYNVFDTCDLQNYGGPSVYDHNGYIGMTSYLNDQLLTSDVSVASVAWTTSLLGNYYLSVNPFQNKGDLLAKDVGLYHYTTLTTQTREADSLVDLGYHYLPSVSGGPIDTDRDGVPDYLEDVNGDGSVTGDPTPYNLYNSVNGLLTGQGLQVFTPLK